MFRLQPSQIHISEVEVFELKQRLHQRRMLQAVHQEEKRRENIRRTRQAAAWWKQSQKRCLPQEDQSDFSARAGDVLVTAEPYCLTGSMPGQELTMHENSERQVYPAHRRQHEDSRSVDWSMGVDGTASTGRENIGPVSRTIVSSLAQYPLHRQRRPRPRTTSDLEDGDILVLPLLSPQLRQSDNTDETFPDTENLSTISSDGIDAESIYQSASDSSHAPSTKSTAEGDVYAELLNSDTFRPILGLEQEIVAMLTPASPPVSTETAGWTTELPLRHENTARSRRTRHVSFEEPEPRHSHDSPSRSSVAFDRSETPRRRHRNDSAIYTAFEDLDELDGDQTVLIRRLRLPDVRATAPPAHPSMQFNSTTPGARHRSDLFRYAPVGTVRRHRINAEQENEDDMEGFEHERQLWLARRQASGDGHMERTPPGQGRFERILWE